MNSKKVRLFTIFRLVLLISTGISFSVISCKKEDPGETPPETNDTLKKYAPVAVTKSNSTKVYVHYMPWFETKESSSNGAWGIHWTMSDCNPDLLDTAGKNTIAAHFYPMIGPYASGDRDVIEYHLLLMKYSGIDGVIIDWYGSSNVNDFGSNRKNTEALIDLLDETGLTFAVTYEDWTTATVVNAGAAPDKISAAKADMDYLQNNYFSNPAYIQIDSRPLLTVFGPQQLQTEAEWTSAFDDVWPVPAFLTLWYESTDAGTNASGEFSWVYQNNTHIDNFCSNRYNSFTLAMGSAYPGFKDYYTEGGWSTSIDWEIDHANGETYRQTLQKAKNKGVGYLQLVTWNDFGEGTMIEPTDEFGYLFLVETQEFTGVSYNISDLETIYTLYQLRKQLAGNTKAQQLLNQAFYYLVSLQVDEAKALLDEEGRL